MCISLCFQLFQLFHCPHILWTMSDADVSLLRVSKMLYRRPGRLFPILGGSSLLFPASARARTCLVAAVPAGTRRLLISHMPRGMCHLRLALLYFQDSARCHLPSGALPGSYPIRWVQGPRFSPGLCASFCDSTSPTSLELSMPQKLRSLHVCVQWDQLLFQHKSGIWDAC